jgi:C1A family cysteine protease
VIGRGLGYYPDEPDGRDWDIDKMALRSYDPASVRVTLSADAPQAYDQGRTSSCVAQAMAGAIHILERRSRRLVSGAPIAQTPSRLFLYYCSRRLHSGGPAIFDNGTYLRTCAKAMNRIGVPDESLWKFTTNPFTVNRQPAGVAYMRGHARAGGEYFRIRDTGAGRVKAIQAALEAGYPVCFGTRVSEDFLRSNGAPLVQRPAQSDPIAGGHAMCIVGYEKRPGGLVFEVRNSWGRNWRDDGHCWFTEDYIRWPHSSDFQIIRGWARLRKGAA